MLKLTSKLVLLASFTLCAALAGYLLHLSWFSPFLADDNIHFLKNPIFSQPIDLLHIFTEFTKNYSGLNWSYRPLYYLSYSIENAMYGFYPGPMRLTNLLIHSINILLIFLISRKLFGKMNLFAGLIIILLPLLHPISWHNILYVSARSTLLVSLFILFAVYLSLLRWPQYLLALVPSLLSLAVKETGLLTLPLIFLVNKVSKTNRLVNAQFSRGYFSVVLILSLVFIAYFHNIILGYLQLLVGERHLHYLLFNYWGTQVIVFMKTYLHILFPIDWAFYFYTDLVTSVGDLRFIFAVLFITFFYTLIFMNRRKDWSLLLLMGSICLLPEFFYPRELLSNEQRMYLPMLFTFFSISRIKVPELFSRQRLVSYAKSFVFITSLCLVFTMSYQRALNYQGIEPMMTRSLSVSDKNIDAYLYLGQRFSDLNRPKQALEAAAKARQLIKDKLIYGDIYKKYYGQSLYLIHHLSRSVNDYVTLNSVNKECLLENTVPYYCGLINAKNSLFYDKPTEAITILNNIEEKTLIVWQLLARAYVQSNKNSEALNVVNELKRLGELDQTLFSIEFAAYVQSGDRQRALQSLNDAITFFKRTDPRVSESFQEQKNRFLSN